MPEQLTDDAIRMLNAQAAAQQAASEADAVTAARRAALQPHEDAIQACARRLDDELDGIRASLPWVAAQAAVRIAHERMAAIPYAGNERDDAEAAYETAIAVRDALTAPAFARHDAAVAGPLAAIAAAATAFDEQQAIRGE